MLSVKRPPSYGVDKARARAEGVYKGRKPSIDVTMVKTLAAEGLGGTEISRRLKIGRHSVYRLLGGG